MGRITVFVLAVLLPLAAYTASFDVTRFPKIAQYVEDHSSVLSGTDLSMLRSKAVAYEKETGEQAVSVLFPNRQGRELADIGLSVYRDNGIGMKQTSNGVLLLIATEEKKIRIVTGYWMEGKLPDSLASRIIENDIRPKANAGDFSGAIDIFYTRLSELPKQAPEAAASWNGDSPISGEFFLYALLIGVSFGVGKISFFRIFFIGLASWLAVSIFFVSFAYFFYGGLMLFVFSFGYVVGIIAGVIKWGSGTGGGWKWGGGFGGWWSGGGWFSWGGGSSWGGGAGD